MSLLNWILRVFSEYVPIVTYQHDVTETSQGIQFSLDGPRYLRPKQKEFLLRGWCFHKTRNLESLRIITKMGTQTTRYGIERHDLLEAFNTTNERVLYSGFEVPLKVARGSTKFILEGKFEDSDWFTIEQEYLVRPRLTYFDPENSIRAKHPYTKWIQEFDTFTREDREGILHHIKSFEQKPLISIVVPVYNTPVKLLDIMIRSVCDQWYDHWELCIADDNSTSKKTRKRLEYWAQRDSRIRVAFRKENGHISACSNTAIEMAKGEYVALLDHDDVLPAHALYYVVNEIINHPKVQIIYSDEDKITPDGYRLDPYFKSDFGQDLLCSHNFVSHLGVYRTDLIRMAGGFREDFVGSQDWDLVLRCLDFIDPGNIRHIQRILYHWRMSNESTSASVSNKDYAVTSGRRALEEYLEKYEPTGKVEDGPSFGSFRIRYSVLNDPLASIIILTRNNAEVLKKCVDSILAKTSYKNFEIIIVDNGSDEPVARELLDTLNKKENIRVLDKPIPFNFSELNNWAAKAAQGDVLVFMNNDMEVIEEDWLRELISHTLRPNVGPVGAKLIFPDGYIQHAGMILGIGGVAGHAFKFLHHLNPGHIGRAGIIQNYSAVTAACMAIQKSIFEKLGGFDQENFGTAYNDTDLCLRAWDLGYRTVYTPHATLYHYESASRGLENSNAKKERWKIEADNLKKKWGSVIENDPFYNPALTLIGEDFSLATPPRYQRPWELEGGTSRGS